MTIARLTNQVNSSKFNLTPPTKGFLQRSGCCICLLMDPVTSIRSIFGSILHSLCPLYFAKSFCVPVSVQYLSILIIVFTEAFPAPPVLLSAYYSLLVVAMLKDVPGGILCLGSVQKCLPKIWSALWKNCYGSTVTYRMLKPLHHDQYSCSFVHIGVPRPSS